MYKLEVSVITYDIN